MSKTVYNIDGARFSTLEGFFEEIGAVLIPGEEWGKNLDAFNDILRGGFGTPDDGFILKWKNSSLSQDRLGYAETARQLVRRLERCHPANRASISEQLAKARDGVGPTTYDWLIETIHTHCANGKEHEDGIVLILE